MNKTQKTIKQAPHHISSIHKTIQQFIIRRIEAGITKAQLAREMGITDEYMHYLESLKSNPTLSTMDNWDAALTKLENQTKSSRP